MSPFARPLKTSDLLMCVEIMQTTMLEAAQGVDAHVRPEVLQRHSSDTDLPADLIGAERAPRLSLVSCHTTCIHGLTASCQVAILMFMHTVTGSSSPRLPTMGTSPLQRGPRSSAMAAAGTWGVAWFRFLIRAGTGGRWTPSPRRLTTRKEMHDEKG